MGVNENSLHGSCLCGAVDFQVGGPFGRETVCHCAQCRRWHGAPGPYTSARRQDMVFSNERGLAWYKSSAAARRGFCRECGSSLFWERLGDEKVSIAIGCLDEPTGLAARHHIFVAFKGDSYDIKDDLPQWLDGNIVE
jgi:hypothetical protein